MCFLLCSVDGSIAGSIAGLIDGVVDGLLISSGEFFISVSSARGMRSFFIISELSSRSVSYSIDGSSGGSSDCS